jgi:hypothetical protein
MSINVGNGSVECGSGLLKGIKKVGK